MPFLLRTPRGAFSLIEVTIALALFFVAMGVVLQALVATKQLSALGEAEDDLSRDLSLTLTTISRDLAETSWHFPAAAVLPSTQAGDRGVRYFPFVQQQSLASNVGGLGTAFRYTWRTEPLIRLFTTAPASRPVTLPGGDTDAELNFTAASLSQAQYLASYTARSQELIFLRESSRPWTADPTTLRPLNEPFPEGDWTDTSVANRQALGILYPSGWEAIESPPLSGIITGYQPRRWDADGNGTVGANEGDADLDGQPDAPYGHLLWAGELNMTDGSIRLQPLWETMDPPDYDPTTTEELREYSYAVVPSPNGGFGRLVRAYKERLAAVAAPRMGTMPGDFITPIPTVEVFGLRVDQVLSDHCTRIVFDTFRTDPTLDVHQVRVRAYFARRSLVDQTLVVFRRLDVVLAMRARIAPTDRLNDLQLLDQSVGIDF